VIFPNPMAGLLTRSRELDPGSTYCAFVWAFNSSGQSTPAGPVFATTSGPPENPRPAPTTFTAKVLGSTRIYSAQSSSVGQLSDDHPDKFGAATGSMLIIDNRFNNPYASGTSLGLSGDATFSFEVAAPKSTTQLPQRDCATMRRRSQ
jgi:hypothetical protein